MLLIIYGIFIVPPMPYLFHVNLLLLSVSHIRRRIRGQLAVIEARRAESAYTWQKSCTGFFPARRSGMRQRLLQCFRLH